MGRMIFKKLILLSIGLSLLLMNNLVWAEDESAKHALALIAPEGRWVVQVEARQTSFDQAYNSLKEKEGLGAAFDDVGLDSNIFPALALLGPTASLGTTQLASKVTSNCEKITLGYGYTEDITLGVIFEYARNENSVSFGVSDGNVGFNPLFDATMPIGATNFPFAPVGGAIAPVGVEGVQNILTSPTFGYEYKSIQTANTSGMGDPIIGGLWRIFENDKQSVVLGGGVRLGLAKPDDPDNLFDVVVSDGSNDAFLQLEYFHRLGAGVDLQLKAVRTWQFEDTQSMRVPAVGQTLATAASKEDLKRNLGDYWEYDIGLGKIMGNWRFGTTLHRYQKSRDSFTSSIGTNTTALSENTEVYADQWRLSVSWSGIDAWQAEVIPLPLIIKLEVQETYKGKNMPDALDIYLLATSFF